MQWIWLVPDIAPAMAGAAVVAPPALLTVASRSSPSRSGLSETFFGKADTLTRWPVPSTRLLIFVPSAARYSDFNLRAVDSGMVLPSIFVKCLHAFVAPFSAAYLPMSALSLAE